MTPAVTTLKSSLIVSQVIFRKDASQLLYKPFAYSVLIQLRFGVHNTLQSHFMLIIVEGIIR